MMDLNYDESWCPVCDRQIMPKRFTVSVPPLPLEQSIPSVPTTSPSDSPSKNQQGDISARIARTKTGSVHGRPSALVQDTGRGKPNGAIKRSNGLNKTRSSSSQQLPTQPKVTAPAKVRTVIDQGPIPLYCSDECRMADLSRCNGALPINYLPDRASPPLPPVPHNSFEHGPSCDSEDESSSASSVDSSLSFASTTAPVSPSIATLAAIYNFPPLPPAPPTLPIETTAVPEPNFRNDYQSGVMMAAKRIQAALCSNSASTRPVGRNELPPPQKPIPGWTDGSDAWRESVYTYSPRSDSVATTIETRPSFAASSSRGVEWTSSDLPPSCSPPAFPAESKLCRSSQSYTDELYAKYSLPLSRRCQSRITLFPPSTSYSSQSVPSRRRETPLVKPGAEGRLLVPNVTMRTHSASSHSLSSTSLCSPVSRYPSEISEDSIWSDQRNSAESVPRPQAQVRSWSYDNIKTYPVMMPPKKKERRIEPRIVDGILKEIEVEVEVVQPLKRLFLFHGKEASPESKW